jgi:hypothetical protein
MWASGTVVALALAGVVVSMIRPCSISFSWNSRAASHGGGIWLAGHVALHHVSVQPSARAGTTPPEWSLMRSTPFGITFHAVERAEWTWACRASRTVWDDGRRLQRQTDVVIPYVPAAILGLGTWLAVYVALARFRGASSKGGTGFPLDSATAIEGGGADGIEA